MMAHLDFKGLQIRKRAFIRKDDPWIQGAPLPSGSTGSPVGEGAGPWQHDAIQTGCCSECRLETTVAAHHCNQVRHVLGLAGSRYYARKHHELSHIGRLHALRGLSHTLHQTACPVVQDNSCWTWEMLPMRMCTFPHTGSGLTQPVVMRMERVHEIMIEQEHNRPALSVDDHMQSWTNQWPLPFHVSMCRFRSPEGQSRVLKALSGRWLILY
jgi:hypothetical protein